MQDSLYVALSAQVALERRLTTIADNVANAGTIGFRATQVKFEDVVTNPSGTSISFVKSGGTYMSAAKGGFRETNNQFDFAIRGDAWFGIETPVGPVMTRDGRFSLTQDGTLVSIEGYPVLDPGGAPIQIEAGGGPIKVSPDGFIRQDGQQVGAIGLYDFKPGANFQRYGNSGVVPQGPPETVTDLQSAGVAQGFLEESNVNPVLEMSRLIMVQRAFESATAAIRQTEATFGDAVKTLGGSS